LRLAIGGRLRVRLIAGSRNEYRCKNGHRKSKQSGSDQTADASAPGLGNLTKSNLSKSVNSRPCSASTSASSGPIRMADLMAVEVDTETLCNNTLD
jgi:hypothetical protein